MLTIFRSNRAELLLRVLAIQLQQSPPDPLQQVQVVVNTWPTSRWLGEQLALRLGGLSAHLRFPFPASHLAGIVDQVLGHAASADPWRASRLVWPLLELLPQLCHLSEGEPLQRWLQQRPPGAPLDGTTWQLGRAIADAFDDYALYRPELLAAWEAGQASDGFGSPLPPSQQWQFSLYRLLRQRLDREPFALRVERAIRLLREGLPVPLPLRQQCGGNLRLFGISSLAPVQVRLLQALSRDLAVDLYLLTPCRDLWQRCSDRRRELRDALALRQPLDAEWLQRAPGLEARFGRLGAEFHQLLEGTGEAQLGRSVEGDLFFSPIRRWSAAAPSPPAEPGPETVPDLQIGLETDLGLEPDPPGVEAEAEADVQGPLPPLLLQLQEHLIDPALWPQLQLAPGDRSLEFHLCPGPLRQVQIVRDRVLQLLAADPELEPRDILVMTPDVERYAPLLASVFSDSAATGVELPWRLTDRSQQAGTGIASTLLRLLQLGGDRLTASALESLLDCRPLQRRFALEEGEILRLNRELQQLGFRWGLDAADRGGDGTHSLSWAMDRLLLALVLPPTPGLALGATGPAAPAESRIPLDLLGRWLHLLQRLRHWLRQLATPRPAAAWGDLLRALLADLFGDDEESAAERPAVLAAVADGLEVAAATALELEPAVVAAVLEEALAVDAGRFGHRSGALTISALEPMRAIPHRVIVLLGLDAGSFPRQRQRPGFHLISQQRQLGDADPADQDRYILLEALLSARSHLLLTWSCREERTGEELPPATPVRHWLDWLEMELGKGASALQVRHPASPLERANFLPQQGRPPASCDRRLLGARLALEGRQPVPPLGLAWRQQGPEGESPQTTPPPSPAPTGGDGPAPDPGSFDHLQAWLMHPQRQWLRQLGMRPREWQDRLADLEPVELDERDRAALLRQARLRQLSEGLSPDSAQHWLERQRGRGLLPARSGAILEAEVLQQRWSSLEASLTSLGEPWSQALSWQGLESSGHGRGEALVMVHCGRESISQRMALWVQLLLACAASDSGGRRPQQAALISRSDGETFSVTCRLKAPEPAAAAAELERLIALQQRWSRACWPAPPRTAWAWLEKEQRLAGSGAAAATAIWEGTPHLDGERQEEEMVVCFGESLLAETLLQGAFCSCATELYLPLLKALESPSGRRKASSTPRRAKR